MIVAAIAGIVIGLFANFAESNSIFSFWLSKAGFYIFLVLAITIIIYVLWYFQVFVITYGTTFTIILSLALTFLILRDKKSTVEGSDIWN